MTLPRLLLPALASGVACLLVALPALRGEQDTSGPRPSGPARVPTAVRVLHDWDRARAAAWRKGDPAALVGLYTRGSAAGRADRELLAAYAGRGLRVTGMRMQVAGVMVESAGSDRLRLVVTDRLVGAVAVGRRTTVALPRDRWSRRRVVLVRAGEGWRVDRVEGQPS